MDIKLTPHGSLGPVSGQFGLVVGGHVRESLLGYLSIEGERAHGAYRIW